MEKTTTADRDNARKKTLDFLAKTFGKNIICKYSDRPFEDVEVIPTGSISLDTAIGVGGFPRGRIIELWGQEASGKSLLTLSLIAECQKAGGTAALIDAEHAMDPKFATMNGVNMDDLYVCQPDYGEQALSVVEALATSGTFDLIVVDSVANLVPKAEIDGDMDDAHVGVQARMMSKGLRKITAIAHKTNTCIVFINQIRSKIGGMGFGGPANTTTGGNSLKFYASLRLEVIRIQTLKDGDAVVGHKCKVKVVKNKVSPPFKEAEYDIIYGHGIDKIGEVFDLACNMGLIDKAGSWYSFNNEKIGQGREKAKEWFSTRQDTFEALKSDVLEILNKRN